MCKDKIVNGFFIISSLAGAALIAVNLLQCSMNILGPDFSDVITQLICNFLRKGMTCQLKVHLEIARSDKKQRVTLFAESQNERLVCKTSLLFSYVYLSIVISIVKLT